MSYCTGCRRELSQKPLQDDFPLGTDLWKNKLRGSYLSGRCNCLVMWCDVIDDTIKTKQLCLEIGYGSLGNDN